MTVTSWEHLQKAVLALNEKRLDDAEEAVAAALKAENIDPQAQQLAGVIAMMRGRPEEAVRRFSRAVQSNPRMPRAHSNLGLAKLEVGFGDEALLHCRRAVELMPADPELVFNLAVVLEANGRLQEAEKQYRRVLVIDSGHAKALLNLGSVLHRVGNFGEAESVFQRGHARFRHAEPFARNLGHTLLSLGRPEEAADAFHTALETATDDMDARAGLVAALRRQGQLDAASEAGRMVTDERASPDLCRQVGMVMLEQGHLESAIELFERGVAAKRTPGVTNLVAGDQLETSVGKLRHDIEQLNWLDEQGLLGHSFSGAARAYEKVLGALPEDLPPASIFSLPFDARRRIQGTYNRIVRRGNQPAMNDGAVNRELSSADVEQDYLDNAPGLTVVDDFLHPAALAGLRRFCLESTVWFDFYHPNGYLGAYLEEGFHCPLLLQVAEDLRRLMPTIIGDLPLRQMWAYKYDSRLEGIEMHADFARVNVNFWITPDDANLDPESGGMLVWDKAAPADWDFDEYNSSNASDQARISKFLENSGARQRQIFYRENRAVIFNSDLFHKTDKINFSPGYANRRINITMLFGARDQQ